VDFRGGSAGSSAALPGRRLREAFLLARDQNKGLQRGAQGECHLSSTGVVKWFNDAKGYGFIATEEDKDIFVHHTSIQANGFRTLAEGEEVEFEIRSSERGAEAAHVTKLM
jgi:CspA family cold shock protein